MITAINGNLIALLLFLTGWMAQDKLLMAGALAIAGVSWLVNVADENEVKYPRLPVVSAIVAATLLLYGKAAVFLLT